jgi:toxin CcdB
MRRFDVCRIKARESDLVVVLQHDSTDHLGTCVVAPLIAPFVSEKETRIRPILRIEGTMMQLQTDRLAAIPRRLIGEVITSVATEQDAIKDAIDRLFIGF